VGRDLWRTSSTSPLLKQGQLKQVIQDDTSAIPVLLCSAFTEGTLCPITHLLRENVKKVLALVPNPALWHPAGLCAANHKPSNLAVQAIFHLAVHFSSLYFLSLSVTMLWETALKASLSTDQHPLLFLMQLSLFII